MTGKQQYQGSCHCGTVRYEVSLALDTVYTCNCSICHKRGLLLAFAGDEDFNLFHKKTIHHYFCKTCGVESFAQGKNPDGSPAFAINVRCLENVELDALKLSPIDGRSF